MSHGEFFATPAETAPSTDDPTPTQGPNWLALCMVVALVAAIGVGGFIVTHSRTQPRDDRPVALPAALIGLPPGEDKFRFDTDSWHRAMAKVYRDHPFAGRQYGTIAAGRLLNLVVVRTDSAHHGDPHLARPPYLGVGDVTCTHSFQLSKGKTSVLEHQVLCYRVSPTLTVSVFVVLGGQAYEQQAAQAVQQAWDLNR